MDEPQRAPEQVVERHDRLAELVDRLNEGVHPEVLVRKTLEASTHLLDPDLVGVFDVTSTGNLLERDSMGWPLDVSPIGPVSPAELGGLVVDGAQPVVLGYDEAHLTPETEMLDRFGVQAGIVASILVDGEPWGMLAVYTLEERGFYRRGADHRGKPGPDPRPRPRGRMRGENGPERCPPGRSASSLGPGQGRRGGGFSFSPSISDYAGDDARR